MVKTVLLISFICCILSICCDEDYTDFVPKDDEGSLLDWIKGALGCIRDFAESEDPDEQIELIELCRDILRHVTDDGQLLSKCEEGLDCIGKAVGMKNRSLSTINEIIEFLSDDYEIRNVEEQCEFEMSNVFDDKLTYYYAQCVLDRSPITAENFVDLIETAKSYLGPIEWIL